jgi:hypothetical protein
MGEESLKRETAEIEYDKTRKQRDTGGDWLVVLAGFTANFCCSGINSVFGLLYVDLERETGTDVLALSWIGSLFIGFSLDSGWYKFDNIFMRYMYRTI